MNYEVNPDDLTPEELEIWNNQSSLNEYHRTRSILALRAVKKMSKQLYSVQEKQEQVRMLKKRKLKKGN